MLKHYLVYALHLAVFWCGLASVLVFFGALAVVPWLGAAGAQLAESVAFTALVVALASDVLFFILTSPH